MQTSFGKGCHLHLIDGSAFIFRAYHALPPLTRKSDGLPIGAVAGFCNMLFKQVEDNKGPDAPTHVAVIFDYSGKSFRNEMYDQYKANRPPAPEDLVPQFPLTRDATRAFNIACGQIDIGNALTDMAAKMTKGVPQANGEVAIEPVMDAADVAASVLHMASLPLSANVQFMTVMASAMPYIGRG